MCACTCIQIYFEFKNGKIFEHDDWHYRQHRDYFLDQNINHAENLNDSIVHHVYLHQQQHYLPLPLSTNVQFDDYDNQLYK